MKLTLTIRLSFFFPGRQEPDYKEITDCIGQQLVIGYFVYTILRLMRA